MFGTREHAELMSEMRTLERLQLHYPTAWKSSTDKARF